MNSSASASAFVGHSKESQDISRRATIQQINKSDKNALPVGFERELIELEFRIEKGIDVNEETV